MMTSEILDSLSDTLLSDERILTLRERELLANLLERARTQMGTVEPALSDLIARTVGEIVAQRAYGVLGESITRRLGQVGGAQGTANSVPRLNLTPGPGPKPSPLPPGPNPPGPHLSLGTGPKPSPLPPGPNPPGPHLSLGTGPKPSPLPPGPNPPGPHLSLGPGPKPSPLPPGPNPPGPAIERRLQAQLEAIAVAEVPRFLAAEPLILEEFLAPAELQALLQHTLDREAEFQLSEVVSPGAAGSMVDHEYRRSRVLMNLGDYRAVVVNRLESCWPRILSRLGHDEFVASHVEVQITASNDGDFFHWHSDNCHEENAPREITFVYFFHREPTNFRGGELRIYDSRWENGGYVPMENHHTIVPQQNQMVLFVSSLAHEITPVECSSQAFADSRFTMNGWFHK